MAISSSVDAARFLEIKTADLAQGLVMVLPECHSRFLWPSNPGVAAVIA
jgi:hypothetical protein